MRNLLLIILIAFIFNCSKGADQKTDFSCASEQSQLNFASYINADSIESIEIDKAEFAINTIMDETIIRYEGGELHELRDTVVISNRDEICRFIQAMRQLENRDKSLYGSFDTRGRISIIYKNGKRENCYFSTFFLFGSDGNLYSIQWNSPTGSTLRRIIISYFNHDDYKNDFP